MVNPRESFQPPGESANMNPDAHLRAFLLYFLGSTFFCGSSGNFAIGALLHYLEDLGKFKDYAWGAAALAHLFWSLDNRVRSGRGRNNLGGFVAIMQVLFFLIFCFIYFCLIIESFNCLLAFFF